VGEHATCNLKRALILRGDFLGLGADRRSATTGWSASARAGGKAQTMWVWPASSCPHGS